MDKKTENTIDIEAQALSHEILARQQELLALQYKQTIIADYKAATDEQLLTFAKSYEDGKNKADNASTYIVGAVDARTASKIKALCGADVSGFSHAIKAGAVRHIINRHGADGKADHSMADLSNLSRIGYVLKNYDSIELSNEKNSGFLNSQNKMADTMIYKKRVNGSVVIIEAITDSKTKNLQIVTSYIEKAKEKESSLPNVNSLGITSETSRNSLTNSISQNRENVNTKIQDKEIGD